MTSSATSTVVVGSLLQTPTRNAVEYRAGIVVAVDVDGLITAVEPRSSAAGSTLLRAATSVVELRPSEMMLPGLIDLHVHAPQWPQLGTGLDLPLEEWLFEYTFPLEARYSDPAFAATVWPELVQTLLRHGTTTAVYFATNDEAATVALAAECLRQGQRAFVGRVAMDHPTGTPDWYRDADPAAGIAASERSIAAIRGLDPSGDLVRPIVTPRFTPACTDELLAGLGELARRTNVSVQTHCSESDWAHGYALERFGVTDTVALDRFGLLGRGSLIAHANHITNEDAALLVERGTGIAHCPLSNAYFANAVLPVRRLLDAGVRIGLGTDVAGGASPGLITQCRDAVMVSRMLEDGVDASVPSGQRGVADSRIDITTAFWMATVGGADVLGLPIGLIEPGRRFDAIVVDTASTAGSLRVRADLHQPLQVFEKIVRLSGPGDITATWVNGRRVSGSRSNNDQ
jgi:guanine deaminase